MWKIYKKGIKSSFQKKTHKNVSQKKHHKRILAITNNEPRLTTARRYFKNIEIVDSFDDISWSDILRRRVRLISVPGKKEARSLLALFKRKAIKLLRLSIRDKLNEISFEDCLFGEHGPKVAFIEFNTILLVYQCHLPDDYQVLEFRNEWHTEGIKALIHKAEHARELGILDEKPGLTIFTNICDDTHLRAYKKVHPNRHIVLRYHDRLDAGFNRYSKEQLLKIVAALKSDGVVNDVESYYRVDAKLLGGIYRPNAVNPTVMAALHCPMRDAIYRFIGIPMSNKRQSRLEALNAIRKELGRIYPNADHWIEERCVLGPSSWKPYPEYLRETARAEVVVDLVRIGQEEGFSFRIPEALFLNRKIITNRLILQDEPFYSPERIFLIGIDPVSRLKTFLESDLEPLPDEVLRLYDARLWWTDEDPRRNIRGETAAGNSTNRT